jgi:N-acetylneuraminic acid mutarotase
VYSATSAGGTLWGIDANGGVMPLVQANGQLPALTAPALAVADNEVALIGGQQTDGTYSSKYYSSSDAGITWTDNWHKTLPSYLGGIAGVSALQLTDGSLLLVGGRNAEGYRNTVWKATLK